MYSSTSLSPSLVYTSNFNILKKIKYIQFISARSLIVKSWIKVVRLIWVNFTHTCMNLSWAMPDFWKNLVPTNVFRIQLLKYNYSELPASSILLSVNCLLEHYVLSFLVALWIGSLLDFQFLDAPCVIGYLRTMSVKHNDVTLIDVTLQQWPTWANNVMLDANGWNGSQ